MSSGSYLQLSNEIKVRPLGTLPVKPIMWVFSSPEEVIYLFSWSLFFSFFVSEIFQKKILQKKKKDSSEKIIDGNKKTDTENSAYV